MCWLVEGGTCSRFFSVIKNLLLIERVQNSHSYSEMSASQRLKSVNIQRVLPPNMWQSVTSGFFHKHFLAEYESDVVFVLMPPLLNFRVFIQRNSWTCIVGVPCGYSFDKTNALIWRDQLYRNDGFYFFLSWWHWSQKKFTLQFRLNLGRRRSDPCVWDCFSLY